MFITLTGFIIFITTLQRYHYFRSYLYNIYRLIRIHKNILINSNNNFFIQFFKIMTNTCNVLANLKFIRNFKLVYGKMNINE